MTLKTTCSGCAAAVRVNLDAGTATGRVPSNGIRGDRHRPAHDVTVDLTWGDDLAWFDCPVGCGYEDSVYIDDEVREALA